MCEMQSHLTKDLSSRRVPYNFGALNNSRNLKSTSTKNAFNFIDRMQSKMP